MRRILPPWLALLLACCVGLQSATAAMRMDCAHGGGEAAAAGDAHAHHAHQGHGDAAAHHATLPLPCGCEGQCACPGAGCIVPGCALPGSVAPPAGTVTSVPEDPAASRVAPRPAHLFDLLRPPSTT